MKQLHRDSIAILIPRYLAQTRDNYDRDTRSEDLFHGLLARRTKGRRPFFQVLVIVVILEEAGTGEGRGTDEDENKPVNEAYSNQTHGSPRPILCAPVVDPTPAEKRPEHLPR